MWGILTDCFPSCCSARFIPTCVGNTSFTVHGSRLTRVHPHVCGEYYQSSLEGQSSPGSSPRVWGILHHYSPIASHGRFIPTCVGNTSCYKRCCYRIKVHPHVCGEYYGGRSHCSAGRGSSPRVWGIRCHFWYFSNCLRFIPTCVGNTYFCDLCLMLT